MEEHCPSAKLIEFEPRQDYVEILYECEGKVFEVAMDYHHNLIYSETDAEIAPRVLSKIKRILDKKYSGWTLGGYSRIEMNDTVFYKFELVLDNTERNAFFTLDGKYFQRAALRAMRNPVFAQLAMSEAYVSAPYDFLNPTDVFDLPDQLLEISGITWADNQTLYCIQDEIGTVFSFNLQSEAVEDLMRFTGVGDFEDIALSKDHVYALRSDGMLYSFNLFGDRQIESEELSLDCSEAEGLYFEETSQSLFLACKSAAAGASDNERAVYQFRIGSTTHFNSFRMDVGDINAYIEREYPEVEIDPVQFNPSAFAIHPKTGHRYVLSASDRLLVVYRGDQIRAVYILPEQVYYKPEGMTFSENGDLFLCSEGDYGRSISGQIYHLPQRNSGGNQAQGF